MLNDFRDIPQAVKFAIHGGEGDSGQGATENDRHYPPECTNHLINYRLLVHPLNIGIISRRKIQAWL